MESAHSQHVGENHIFLWMIWAALGLSSFAEVILTVVTSPPGEFSLQSSVSTLASLSPTLVFLLGLAVSFAAAIGVVFKSNVGGGGIATGLICWFLAKGIAVCGISTYFIFGDPILSGLFTVSFLIIIGLLNPRRIMARAQ